MSSANQLVLAIVICVASVGPTIWLAVTAKPIGKASARKPYRWGTWVALASAITSLAFLPPALIAVNLGQPVVTMEYLTPLIALVATCLLLLNRKRSGVVLFFITHLLLIILNLLGPERVGQLALFRQKAPAAGMFLYVVINAVYFAKRWPLLEPSSKQTQV